MKIKHVLIFMVFILMSLSIAEIFPIAPGGSFWYPWYRSDYFSEIDKQYQTVIDSFLSMKLSGKKESAWLYINEMKERSQIKIDMYNTDGNLVLAPGSSADISNPEMKRIALSQDPQPVSYIKNGMYFRAVPIALENKCRICHNESGSSIAGIMTFERPVNKIVYFSAERRLLFTLIALVCGFFIFLLLRWDPDKKINEFLNK